MANNKSNVINGTIPAVGSWRNAIEPLVFVTNLLDDLGKCSWILIMQKDFEELMILDSEMVSDIFESGRKGLWQGR